MAKKVKSFALEENAYEQLSARFRANYVDVTISYCLNKYIKELLAYLEMIEKGLHGSSHTIPMAFIIETVTREPLFRVLEPEPRPGREESSLSVELNQLQKKYDAHIERNPEAAIDFASSKLEKDFPIIEVLTYFGKAVAKRIKSGEKLTDDEYVELIREIGGKEFHKYLRETVAPNLEKIDVAGKVGKALRKNGRAKTE